MAVACCCGMMLADRVSFPFVYWLGAMACCLAGAMVCRERCRRGFMALLCFAFLFLGAGRLQWVSQDYDSLPHYLKGAAVTIEGTIQEKGNSYLSDNGKMMRYIVSLDRFSYQGTQDIRRGAGHIYVTMPYDDQWQPSARVRLQCVVQPIRYYRNHGAYDARHRDKEKNVFLKTYMENRKDAALRAEPKAWQYRVQQVREGLTAQFQRVLDRDSAYILSSLLFGGHYDDIPSRVIEAFSTTGLIHILSVSGSHIALLLTLIQCIGRLLGWRAKITLGAALVFVVLYGALSEFVAPVVRASMMGMICAYSVIARREYTASHALGIAVLVMVLYSPFIVFDLSFRLSCGASAGIVLLQQPIRNRLLWLPLFIRDSLTVCICAQLLLVPLLLASFYSLPLYSLLANILIAPVLDGIIMLGLIAAAIGIVCEPVMDGILYVISPLLAMALKGNFFIAALPYSRVWIGAMSYPFIIGWYGAMSALFFCKRVKPVLAMVLVWLVAAWGWSLYQRPEATIYVFDVGKDKATCIRYSDSSVQVWYNKSRWANSEQVTAVLVPAMRYEGLFAIQRCVITGHEPEAVKRQLEAACTITEGCQLTGDTSRDAAVFSAAIPYSIYEDIPKEFGTGCIEMRTLPKEIDRLFPQRADALIIHRTYTHDEVYTQWQEGAALYDMPCFSPAEDGQITGTYRRGVWTFSTYGGDT